MSDINHLDVRRFHNKILGKDDPYFIIRKKQIENARITYRKKQLGLIYFKLICADLGIEDIES